MEVPFAPSLMVEFSNRLTEDILMDINELILKGDDDDDQSTSGGGAGRGSNTQEAKGSYGLGLIRTKLEETTRGSIVLSILVMNLNRKLKMFSHDFFISIFSRFNIRKIHRIKIYAVAVAT